MIAMIPLREPTRKLMEALPSPEKKLKFLSLLHDPTTHTMMVNKTILLKWIKENHPIQSTTLFLHERFIRESLQAALLSDLQQALSEKSGHKVNNHPTIKPRWHQQIGLLCLSIAGIVSAISISFDGITSILWLFTGIPVWAVFIVGFTFAVFSAALFYFLNLVEISKNLGVELKQSQQLLDIFLEQINAIKLIQKNIRTQCDLAEIEQTQLSTQKLTELLEIVEILEVRFNALDEVRQIYRKEQNSLSLQTFKSTMALITGVLFFSYGFFAWQTLFMASLSLCGITLSVLAPPVLWTSVVIGLFGFGVYWFEERLEIEKLVSRWFGLDHDKIDQLTDPEIAHKQADKLKNLKARLQMKLVLKSKAAEELKPASLLSAGKTVSQQKGNHSALPKDITKCCMWFWGTRKKLLPIEEQREKVIKVRSQV